MTERKNTDNIFLRMHPLHRVLLGMLLTIITYFSIRKSDYHLLQMFIILWDVFAFPYLISCWIVFFTRSTLKIREEAKKEDGSKFFVFALILLSSFAGMFTVLLLTTSKQVAHTSAIIPLPVIIAGMLFSWIMVHTTFVFHYAHLYYNDNKLNIDKYEKGLSFPNEEKPDYLDFAYFSFVVGMTFQVSDVEITSRTIRRLTLVHGLISFFLNTFVVALTINIIAGIRN